MFVINYNLMPETITKPKSWLSQVCELEVNNELPFPLSDHGYIKSMVSGEVKRRFPLKAFTVVREEKRILVTRLADKEI